MTPSALTPAARKTTKKSRQDASSRPSSSRGSGHRATVRRSVAPAAPRRVSGPAGGVVSAAASVAASAASVASGVIAVPAPTRTRPARPARPPRTGTRTRTRTAGSAAAKLPWGLRTSAYVRRLPDHALLDRIIRGRVWIPLLGVLLAGIVAMQVEVLKLNAGIGRSLERSSALQGQNELLRANVARLSDDQRIERMAAQMGMVMPAPTQLHFVRTGATTVERALGSIHAPNGTSFIAQQPTIGAPAAAQGTTVNTGVGLTPTTASSTATSSSATSSTAASPATTSSTAASSAQGSSATSSTDTSSTSSTGTSTPAATGTGTSGTADSGSGSTSGTSAVAPTGTTTAGGTDQSGSSGGVGATPVGG